MDVEVGEVLLRRQVRDGVRSVPPGVRIHVRSLTLRPDFVPFALIGKSYMHCVRVYGLSACCHGCGTEQHMDGRRCDTDMCRAMQRGLVSQ